MIAASALSPRRRFLLVAALLAHMGTIALLSHQPARPSSAPFAHIPEAAHAGGPMASRAG